MSRPRESNHAARNHKGGHRSGNHWEIEGDRRDLDQDLKKAQRTYAGGEDVAGQDADGLPNSITPGQGFRGRTGAPVKYHPGRVVYEAPSQEKEDFELRQKIRDTGVLAPKAKNSMLNYTVDQRDVEYIKERERAALERSYHEWLLNHFDPRTSEGKRILKRQAPELLARMVETMKSEHELSMRMQEIDMLGIDENRPGDLQLLFLLDQQALVDKHKTNADNNYIRGLFMPKLKPVKAKHSDLWARRGHDRLKRPHDYGPTSYSHGENGSLNQAPGFPNGLPLTKWLESPLWGKTEAGSNANQLS